MNHLLIYRVGMWLSLALAILLLPQWTFIRDVKGYGPATSFAILAAVLFAFDITDSLKK